MWAALNLSLLAISSTLLLLATVEDHFAECTSTPMWESYCTLSGNAFALKELGYNAIKAAGDNEAHIYLIDVVRVCTPIQFIGAFIAWLAYFIQVQFLERIGVSISNKLFALVVLVLTHIAGWVIFAAVFIEEPYFSSLIDPAIIGSQANSIFSIGSGLIMSMTATVLEVVIAISISAELLFA